MMARKTTERESEPGENQTIAQSILEVREKSGELNQGADRKYVDESGYENAKGVVPPLGLSLIHI